MEQETKQWINFADMDYGVAQHLFDTCHPKPCEIICYHCQQAAENLLAIYLNDKRC